MWSDFGLFIYAAAVLIVSIGFLVFTIFWVLPKGFRQMRKEMRKATERLRVKQAAERMRGKDVEVTTKEFERRREEVTSHVKDRLELMLDCNVTLEDYIAWQRQIRKRKKRSQTRSLLLWLCWPSLMLLLGLYGILYGEWNWTLLTLIFGSGALVLIFPLIRWVMVDAHVRALAKQKALSGIGPRRFLLTATSVIEVDERTTNELPWQNVQRIDTEGAFTMLYVTPGLGWFFPGEAFSSPEEYERFIIVAKECWSRTRPVEEEPQPVLLPHDPAALLPRTPSQDIRQ